MTWKYIEVEKMYHLKKMTFMVDLVVNDLQTFRMSQKSKPCMGFMTSL